MTALAAALAAVIRGERAPDWQDSGLCAQTDPDEWFPPIGRNADTAKRVCAACPVQTECLEHAIARNERHGVWGGASVRERDRIRAQRETA